MHAALVAAVAVPRRLNTVHVGAVVGPRPQHLWSAEDGVTSKSAESCPSWDRTRTLLIQSVAPRSQSSDNALSLREFASFVVGKISRNVGACEG